MSSFLAAPSILLLGVVSNVTAPADTNENICASFAVPPLGPNDALELIDHWDPVNNGNVKTPRWRLSGIGGTALTALPITSMEQWKGHRILQNLGATNAQSIWGGTAGGGGWSSASTEIATAAVDTSVATTLVLTMQKATGADSVILRHAHVKLLRG